MLGKVFAFCGDEEQAQFLNEAGRNLRRTCGDVGHLDMQCCMIVDHLDGNGRELIKRLADFIRCDEETPQVVKRVVYEDEVRAREGEGAGA